MSSLFCNLVSAKELIGSNMDSIEEIIARNLILSVNNKLISEKRSNSKLDGERKLEFSFLKVQVIPNDLISENGDPVVGIPEYSKEYAESVLREKGYEVNIIEENDVVQFSLYF